MKRSLVGLALVAVTAGAVVVTAVAVGAPKLPTAGRVVARIAVPDSPLGLLPVRGAVWVASHRSEKIYRISTQTNKITAEATIIGANANSNSGQPARLLMIGGSLFAVNYSANTVSIMNPQTGKLLRVLKVKYENCCWPTVAQGKLWLLGFSSAQARNPDRLSEVDPATGQVIFSTTVPSAQGLVYGNGSLWGTSNSRLFRFDLATKRIAATIHNPALPFGFAFNSVWGLNGAQLIRVDPATNRVAATIELPSDGAELTVTRDAIWIDEGPLDAPGSHLWKVDPRANKVVGSVSLGTATSSLDDIAAASDGSLWVTQFDANRVLRVSPS